MGARLQVHYSAWVGPFTVVRNVKGMLSNDQFVHRIYKYSIILALCVTENVRSDNCELPRGLQSKQLNVFSMITAYVSKLLQAVYRRRSKYPSYRKALEAAVEIGLATPPPLTASYVRVPRQALIDRHRSRF